MKQIIQGEQVEGDKMQIGSQSAVNIRRSKKEMEGRDFVCFCGKAYLSYSALYTHSKVKHNEKITLEQCIYSPHLNDQEEKFNFLDL